MMVKVSIQGQVVIPKPIRRRLGVRAGDSFEVKIEAGRIVLTPRKKRSLVARIVSDPVTGLPVLSAGPDAPTLSSKEVAEIVAEFP
jgi:AbrB family looped-hinge helix DNA binding protein